MEIKRTNLKLSGVEYLCLCMQQNPGQSKRYYLRRKNTYQNGSDYSKGANGMTGYFRPGCFYDYNLWTDSAPLTVKVKDWMGRTGYQPRSCQMYLTQKGWDKANTARKKLGLKPLAYNEMI
jgi:hypothetical protein